MSTDFKDLIEKDFERRSATEISDLSREEQLELKIKEFEIFIKYLNYVIDDFNIRIRRLRLLATKEKSEKSTGPSKEERIKISKERKEKVIHLRKTTNMTINQIANKLGINYRTVCKYLEDYN